ncbi:MAG TPA: ATP-grasp fold amidoligase family protein [Longimicrobiales bacterium]|nr:ATP-grasp fold amidoligase family protein [Longimicrobiales bacterium]
MRDRFERRSGYTLDLDAADLFSERLTARMILLHRSPDLRMKRLTDKFAVRPFVEQRVGAEYLSQLLWHGASPRDIPFDDLPDRYVAKPNHASGLVVHGDPEIDRREAIEYLEDALAHDYYWKNREAQYYGIERRVLVEERLDDGLDDGPRDYSFFCFHGRPHAVQVRNRIKTISQFHDLDWKRLSLRLKLADPVELDPPRNLDEMIDVSSRLSEGFDFVRVDLYDLGDRVVFGEMTFTPAAGGHRPTPEEWDVQLGRLWGDAPNP